jgi:hypothetical protein
MSHRDTTGEQPDPQADRAALEEEIERTRADLADTVDELTARLDVKARVHDKVEQVKHDAGDQLHHLADRATDDRGRPTPAVIAVAAAFVVGMIAVVVMRRRRSGR